MPIQPDYEKAAREAGWYYDRENSEWRKSDDSAPDGYRYAATADHALRLNAM